MKIVHNIFIIDYIYYINVVIYIKYEKLFLSKFFIVIHNNQWTSIDSFLDCLGRFFIGKYSEEPLATLPILGLHMTSFRIIGRHLGSLCRLLQLFTAKYLCQFTISSLVLAYYE